MAVSNSTDRFNGYLASLATKAPCVVATDLEITLSGEQTVAGVAVVSGDRVLVKDQSNAVENGIYEVRGSGWERTPDFDGNRDITTDSVVFAGVDQDEPILYRVTGTDPYRIGTDPVSIEEMVNTSGGTGGGSVSAEWRFDDSTTDGDPGNGDFRYDSATPASVTEIYISSTSNNGVDFDTILGALSAGNQLYIQPQKDANDYLLATVVSVTDETGWWTIVVTVDASGTLPNDRDKCGLIMFALGGGGRTDADNILISNTLPKLDLNETDATAENRRWSVYASGGALFLVSRNDADDASGGVLRVDRTGNVIDNILMFTEINMADNILNRSILRDYAIEQVDYTPTGTSQPLVYADGPAFTVDLESVTGNVTLSITGGPSAGNYGQVTVRVQQDSTVARTVTWGGGDTYRHAGGTAHPMNTTLDGYTIYTLETFDAGASWEVAGQDYS